MAYGPQQSMLTTGIPPTSLGSPGYTLGTRFTALAAGRIISLKYFRRSADTTTSRSLRLWSEAGALAASGTTAAESGNGWLTVMIGSPVIVSASSSWRVAQDQVPAGYCFGNVQASEAPDLQIVGGCWTATVGAYPANSDAENYWADVVFEKEILDSVVEQLTIGNTASVLQNVVYSLPTIPLTFTSGAQIQSSLFYSGPFTNVANGPITGCFIKPTANTTITLQKVIVAI